MTYPIQVSTDDWTTRGPQFTVDDVKRDEVSTEEQTALAKYAENARQHWTLTTNPTNIALLMGYPIRPIKTEVFDQLDDHALPATVWKFLTDIQFELPRSAQDDFFEELKHKQNRTRSLVQKIKRRVAFLKAEGIAEGRPINIHSEHDFWEFMNSQPFFVRPRIFLLERGDLRAVWKGNHGEHLGLQFLGSNRVQYVMFVKRPGSKEISRVYGRDTMPSINRLIEALELSRLIAG